MIEKNHKIEHLAGIGPATAFKLRQAGVATIELLMDSCADAGARRQLSARTGINPDHLQRWAGMARLVRCLEIDVELARRLADIGIGDPEALAKADATQIEQRLALQPPGSRDQRPAPTLTELQALIRRAASDR